MKTARHRLNRDEAGMLIAFSALLFGGWTRIYPAIAAGFPINDGGLFYKMVEVLQENHYNIPSYFEFNGYQIPFAYPPLAFYLTALINDFLNIPLILLFQYVPAIILIFTIPVFYEFAKVILGDKFQAGIATLIFALTPRSLTWYIMGGGVTRAPGLLFLLLAIRSAYQTFVSPNIKNILLTIVFGTLVVLTHPEAALHSAGIILLMWLFKARSKKGLLTGAAIGAGVMIATSFWWAPLLLGQGFGPILSASKTSLNGTAAILYPFVSFDDEPSITFIMALAFLGILTELASAKLFLPALYFLPFVLEVRSAANVAIIPLALLASAALCRLIIPGVYNANLPPGNNNDAGGYKKRILYGSGAFITLYLLSGMLYYSTLLVGQHVSKSNREAFEWIRNNTPMESRFLVLTGNFDLFRDWTLEWFPAYTDRVSLTTIQGREWIDGENFHQLIIKFQNTQACIYKLEPMKCLLIETNVKNLGYDYIYISRVTADIPLEREPRANELFSDLNINQSYERVFDNGNVTIYKLSSNLTITN